MASLGQICIVGAFALALYAIVSSVVGVRVRSHELVASGQNAAWAVTALITAAATGKNSSFGYSFVSVSKGSPETVNLWHNGNTVLTADVNTGVAGADTSDGVFPVFEHIESGTMSGTNVDGSTYVDPGIPWISYFNGGEALHGFVRSSYGSPQSNGCVEMPIDTVAKVWPYTPIGTLVTIEN